jgi:hypothetical protein
MTMTTMMTSSCDPSSTNNEGEDEDDVDESDEVVADPYDNLPEQDEPTHCSICLTYRQGPCRPYWRKVEACTKDNELPDKEEDDATNTDPQQDDEQKPDPPCFKYMLPWIDCASSYRNLYALIELDTNYTEGIVDLEATASDHLCWVSGQEPFTIDWSNWIEYVEILNPQWKLPSSSSSSSSSENSVALWKTLDQSSDPELVQVEAKVPTIFGGGVLECAYALDQDNHVVGFAYGTKPSEAARKHHKANDDDNDNNDDDEDDPTVTLTIRLLPERTKHIVIAAAYTQVVTSTSTSTATKDNNNTTEKDGRKNSTTEQSHVYKSKPYRLDDVVVAKEKEE